MQSFALGRDAYLLGAGRACVAWVESHQVKVADLDGKAIQTLALPIDIETSTDTQDCVSPSGRYVVIPTLEDVALIDLKSGGGESAAARPVGHMDGGHQRQPVLR